MLSSMDRCWTGCVMAVRDQFLLRFCVSLQMKAEVAAEEGMEEEEMTQVRQRHFFLPTNLNHADPGPSGGGDSFRE